jgi:hypothetical protein
MRFGAGTEKAEGTRSNAKRGRTRRWPTVSMKTLA